MKKQFSTYISLVLAMAIVGSSVVVGKLMVKTIPVFLSSGIRFFIAAAVLMILLFGLRKAFPLFRKKMSLFFCCSLLRVSFCSASACFTGLC